MKHALKSIVAVVIILAALNVAPALAAPTGCASAKTWMMELNRLASPASDEATADINAGDYATALVIVVQLRHEVAALPYGTREAKVRAATIETLDELAYENSLLLTDASSIDMTDFNAAATKQSRLSDDLAATCGWSAGSGV